MLGFLGPCIGLPLGTFYESAEWWVVLPGQAAHGALGTQGYSWDTQSDMFTTLLGALWSVTLLARLQDRQIRRLGRACMPV